MRCQECKTTKDDNIFYKIVKEKLNVKTNEYEKYNICKQCLQLEFVKHDLLYICKTYNLYYDITLWNCEEEYKDDIKTFSNYIRLLSSLMQYRDKKYKDSVFLADGITLDNINTENATTIKEKSDIDFLNEDIKQLKKNIEKAIQKEDFNSHNKWMNCLRDAIELRDRLQGNTDCIINIGTIMVKDETDITKLTDELSKIAKRNVSLR